MPPESDLPLKVAVLETKVERLEDSMDHLTGTLEKTNEKLQGLINVISEAKGGRSFAWNLAMIVGAPTLIATVIGVLVHKLVP